MIGAKTSSFALRYRCAGRNRSERSVLEVRSLDCSGRLSPIFDGHTGCPRRRSLMIFYLASHACGLWKAVFHRKILATERSELPLRSARAQSGTVHHRRRWSVERDERLSGLASSVRAAFRNNFRLRIAGSGPLEHQGSATPLLKDPRSSISAACHSTAFWKPMRLRTCSSISASPGRATPNTFFRPR